MSNPENKELTPYQKKMLIFFFKCIGSELSKTAIFLIIFTFLGLTSEFWAALFFMMLYRTSSGGLHCKSYLSCLTMSFFILFSGIMLGTRISVELKIIIPSTLIMAAIACYLSPVQAPTRPPLEEHLVRRAKRRTFISIMIFLITACFFPKTAYAGIGFWFLILHDIQLCAAYLLRRYKKNVALYT